VDAAGASDEGAALRTAKSCGPDASTLASSWWKKHPPATVTIKPDSPGRARRKPLKPLARGMPGDPGVTVVTMLVCSSCFACEAAGAIRAPGIPCALCHQRRDVGSQTRAIRAARSRSRGCLKCEIDGLDESRLPAWRMSRQTQCRPCESRDPERERNCAHRGAAALLCATAGRRLSQGPGPVVMGPCFRRDDRRVTPLSL
jgi:hypothetical protein